MKLNLKNLESLSKAVSYSCPKTGDKRKDSIYFDFKSSKLTVHNDKYNGSISFNFTTDFEDESFTNFYVDTTKFFYILKDMDSEAVEISFEEKDGSFIPTFKKGSNVYKISYIIAEEEDISLLVDDKNFKILNLSAETIKLIEQASMFVDSHDEFQFNSVAIGNDGKVYGTTPTRFFSAGCKEKIEDSLFFHRDLSRVLSTFSEGCKILYDDNKIIIKDSNFTFIYGTGASHSVIPSEGDKAGVVSFDSHIVVNKKEFADCLKFFDPFYVSDSKPIRLTVINKEEVKISTVSSYDVVEKIVKLIDPVEDLIDFTAKYNATIIKSALSVLSDSRLLIYLKEDKIGAVFTDEEKSKETVIIKYSETD